MGANLKTAFCVDVEATCWANKEEQGNKPNEVIEIGIVALDIKNSTVIQKRSYPVKPRFTEVSTFCTDLTGWTQADMDEAPDIIDVLSRVKDDFGITKHHIWFSYGEYDRIKLDAGNALLGGSLGQLYGLPRWASPFSEMRAHINIKTLMAIKHQLKDELGLARALAFYNEKLEGRHHNGADDAANIAKIIFHVLGHH